MNMKNWIKALAAVVFIVFITGCGVKEHTPIPSFSATQFSADKYLPKIDNFLIVFDASISMRHKFKEEVKLDIAKAVVTRMNQNIPAFGQTAGLRTFGHAPEFSKENTTLPYGMAEYSSQDLARSFNVDSAGGLSRLDKALNAAQADFEGLSGSRNAVIIISDGMDIGTEALESARQLKEALGSSICFYTIQIGDDPQGKMLLQNIVKTGDCGLYLSHENILKTTGMRTFVENEFLAEKPPEPVVAAAKIVPTKKDSDKDGIYDGADQCPGTPYGAHVNAMGCWTLDHVLFGFNESIINIDAYPMIDKVVAILEKNPSMKVTLQGNTDNVGSSEYNMALSLKRAEAVKEYLIRKGIAKHRLATQGFGFTKPVGLNSTETGRSLNRRVEIKP